MFLTLKDKTCSLKIFLTINKQNAAFTWKFKILQDD